MSYRSFAARKDANQDEIVDALRKAGATVKVVHQVKKFCDICVGVRGRNYLLEIKVGKAGLTKDEEEFHGEWRGQVTIVRSIREALEACGLL